MSPLEKIEAGEIINIVQLMKAFSMPDAVQIIFSESNTNIVVRWNEVIIGNVTCDLNTNNYIIPSNCQSKELLSRLIRPMAIIRSMTSTYMSVGPCKYDSDYSEENKTIFNSLNDMTEGGIKRGELVCIVAKGNRNGHTKVEAIMQFQN